MSVTGVAKAKLYRRLATGVKLAAGSIIIAAGAYQFAFASALSPSFGDLQAFLSVTFNGDRQFQVFWGPKPEGKAADGVVAAVAPSQAPATPAAGAPQQRSAANASETTSPSPETTALREAIAPTPTAATRGRSLAVCALAGRPEGGGGGVISRASIEGSSGVVDGFGVRDATLMGSDGRPSGGYILPLLASIKSQGGLAGLKPILASFQTPGVAKLPNTLSAPNEGSGAFVLSVAHQALDMLQVGGGSYVEELNPWYHSLNAGMRTQIVGGLTCSAASDVEVAASPASGPSAQMSLIRSRFDQENLYVSDGKSAVSDFTINGRRPDRRIGGEVKLEKPGAVMISATLSATLPAQPAPRSTTGWSLERARYGATRSVNVEIVANGKVVATKPMLADGSPHTMDFMIPVERSSWIALRLMGGGHSNPGYVIVDNEPIRPSRSSVEWSQRALLQAYDSQSGQWSEADAPVAAAAFQYAYAVYDSILKESEAP